MGGSPTSTQQPGDSDADESLAQLRALGRQLLQGWAEALAALAKLPGVGGMRVDTLATRLGELSREASPTAAAAALAADNGSGRAAAADSSAAPQAGSRSAPPGPPPPPSSELAGPNSGQRQAYSDPVDMFATAAKSAHLSYPELLHAFAASAEGAPLLGGGWAGSGSGWGGVWAEGTNGRVPIRQPSSSRYYPRPEDDVISLAYPLHPPLATHLQAWMMRRQPTTVST